MGGWSRWRRLALPRQAVMAAFSARAACLKSGKPPRKKFLALPTCARGVSTLKPPIGCISWPLRKAKCEYYSSLIEQKYLLLEKCFGFIDGLNLPVNVSGNEE